MQMNANPWIVPLVGEYLDIDEITRLGLTCQDIWNDPVLYSMFLGHENNLVDTFVFLLTRYQQLVNDLHRACMFCDMEEQSDFSWDIHDMEEQLDYSWDMLKRFVLKVMKKPEDQKIRVRGLLGWDIQKDSLDMSVLFEKLHTHVCFL